MRIFMRLGALAVLVLALAACIVENDKPLSDAAKGVAEPRLAGRWIDTEKGEATVTVTPDAATGGRTMTVVYRETNKDATKTAQITFRAWRTTIAGRDFLDLETTAIEGPEDFKKTVPKRLILSYAIDASGELVLRFLSRTAFAAAVREGKLKGTLQPGEYGAVRVAASPDELLAFLRERGDEALEASGSRMRRAS